MKKKTFYDIAEHTGLSLATISRYYNNPGIVSESTKKKIESAINEVGYTENKFAKSLATGETDLIGIIVPGLELDFYSKLLSEILVYSSSLGLKCLVYNSNSTYEQEVKFIKEIQSYQAIGIINYSHALKSDELKLLNPNTVVIEREFGSLKSVSSDNSKGGVLAFNHLKEIKCEVFININTPDNNTPVYNRTKFFIDKCIENDVTYELIEVNYHGDNYWENVSILQNCVELILEKYRDKKIGIFMSNDYFASIIKNQFIKKGVNIPQDVAIVGFDNSPISYHSSMQITTIKQDIQQIAKSAVDLLLKDDKKHELIDVELIVRDTTLKS